MDERQEAGHGGSTLAEGAALRLEAATRLLSTLRAGRMRVERLAEESLRFDQLVRVVSGPLDDDSLVAEVRRTQDLIETRLQVWRELRTAAADAYAQTDAGAPAPAQPLPQVDDSVSVADLAEDVTDDDSDDIDLGAPVAAAVAVGAGVASVLADDAAADDAAAEDDAAEDDAEQTNDADLDLDARPDDTEEAAIEDDAATEEEAEEAAADAEDVQPDEDDSLSARIHDALPDIDDEPSTRDDEEPTLEPEPVLEPEADEADDFLYDDEEPADDDSSDGAAAVVAAAPTPVSGLVSFEDDAPDEEEELDIYAPRPDADDLVLEEDEDADAGQAADEDEDEDEDAEEDAGLAGDDSQLATDYDVQPVDEELDTLNDFELMSSEVHEDAATASGTPSLASYFGSEDDDEPATVDEEDALEAGLVPDPGMVEGLDGESDDDDDDDDDDGEATMSDGLAGPQAVAPQVMLAQDDDDDDDDDEPMPAVAVAPSPGNEAVTSELAAVPASDDFLYDDDDAASQGGFSVSLERPDTEEYESVSEDIEPSGAPRLTDDEPIQNLPNFDDELAVQPVEEVDEDALAAFLADARGAEKRGDLHAAITHYGDAMDLAPDRREAFLGRGRAHLELGDYSSAMSDFQRAEDLAPGAPEPLVEMGNLYFARKEYRRAIDFYDQALEIDGALAMARCRRGISHHYRRNHKAAFQDLQKAYALDPDIPNIRKYVQMAVKAMERDRGRR